VGAGVVETEATCSASSSDASNPGIAGVGGILPQKSVCVAKKDGQPAEATTAQGNGNDTFEEISQRDPGRAKAGKFIIDVACIPSNHPPWICHELAFTNDILGHTSKCCQRRRRCLQPSVLTPFIPYTLASRHSLWLFFNCSSLSCPPPNTSPQSEPTSSPQNQSHPGCPSDFAKPLSNASPNAEYASVAMLFIVRLRVILKAPPG